MVLDAGGHIPDCGIPLSSAYTALSLTPSVLCQWKYCISFFFSLGIGLFKKTVREREGKRKVEFQIKCGRGSAEGSWCGGRLPSQPDVEAMGGQRGGRGRLDPQQRVGREKAVCSCKKMLNGFSCFQPRESLILGLSEKRADSKGGKDFFLSVSVEGNGSWDPALSHSTLPPKHAGANASTRTNLRRESGGAG